MARPRVDAATRRAQGEASDPKASAWVSANAGSGKTFVLARRVVRLLLAGTDPGRILCLTFTKAAAAQMASRVFEQLAAWAVLPDAELAKELTDIEGRVEADDLVRARRLFARALETPGGLKVQTIHAFCERLLHQFPFEANVAGHFEVLDERDAAALADAARRTILARANADPGGPLGQALAVVIASASDMMNDLAVAEFVRNRDRVRAWIVAAGSLDEALAELRDRLGVGPAEDPATLQTEVATGSLFPPADIERLIGKLLRSSANDKKAADRLLPWRDAKDQSERGLAFLEFWTKSDGGIRDATKIVSKAVKDFWPGLDELLIDEGARIEALLARISAAECYRSSAAMLTIANAAIGEYDAAKKRRGVLDFDDLIVSTVGLFQRPDASRWVHYKLDRGLDHILVDEAQDTSPRQWQVVKALVEEFFAGEGAATATRTLFAVGDEKQSIFSFQGAVPRWFVGMQQELGTKARAAGYTWNDPKLHLSFRSTQAVLDAVDTVFAGEARRGLTAGSDVIEHTAARHRDPGRVILWPLAEAVEGATPPDWTAPLDELGEASPEVQLADRIARTIAGWFRDKERLDATGEPIRPGGILILSRTRGAQTDAIIRALKTSGIPIAGADRLTLTDHIAVMDLMALGRIMILPEDDLALASLLKSPLIGLSEDDLFTIAYGRGGVSLWEALGQATVRTGGVFAEARAKLDGWRRLADYLDPHAFFARVLGPDGGRRRFMERLGAEAEDVLDEFLAQALAYEQANTPSLEGFLAWLEAAETDIKRDTETVRNEVRVMTVHGAKGLEADIVFLVDTGAAPVHHSHVPRVVALDDDRDGVPHPLVWMRKKKAMPPAVEARVDALRDQAEEEYRRLLYVAMTRARDRLYICGVDKQIGKDDKPRRWHAVVSAALESGCTRHEGPGGAVTLEWRAEPRKPVAPKPEQVALDFWPQFPPTLFRAAPPPPAGRRRLTPSTAVAEAAAGDATVRRAPPRFDDAVRQAMERGRIVHRLLQSLPDAPPARREEIGGRYLAAAAPSMPAPERAALLGDILALLADPAFAPVFAEGSRAEVEVAGRIGEAALSGRIDRLAVTDRSVLIVDYKTNRPAPERLEDAPHDYVIQLALYCSVLGRLYPGKAVAAAILWTDRPSLMEIPSAALDAAETSVSERFRAS